MLARCAGLKPPKPEWTCQLLEPERVVRNHLQPRPNGRTAGVTTPALEKARKDASDYQADGGLSGASGLMTPSKSELDPLAIASHVTRSEKHFLSSLCQSAWLWCW